MAESSSSVNTSSSENKSSAVINALQYISTNSGLPFDFLVNLYVNVCNYDQRLFIKNIKDLFHLKEVTSDEITFDEQYACLKFMTGLSEEDMYVMDFKIPEDKDMCEVPHNILSVEYAQQALLEIEEQEQQTLEPVEKEEDSSSAAVEEQVSSTSSTGQKDPHSTKRSRSEEPVRKSDRISEKKTRAIETFAKSTTDTDEIVLLSNNYENNFDGVFKYEELLNDKFLS
jgi:hypothetical protein